MAKTQIDLMPIALAAGAYLVYKAGLLDPLLIQFGLPPVKALPSSALTEDQAALIVSSKRLDVCPGMVSMSGGQWHCNTQAATIATIREWFYHVDPNMVPTYKTLAGYVEAMGWG